MINFKPTGCFKCMDALNEILRQKGAPLDLRQDQWISTIGERPGYDPLMPAGVFEAACASVVILQQAICEGKATACYVTPNGLTDVKPGEAMTEYFTRALASGRISDGDGRDTALFIRDKRKNEKAALKKHAPKRLALARHYWATFPEGHKEAGREFKQALDDLARAMGRDRIPATSLKNALSDYPTPQDLPS